MRTFDRNALLHVLGVGSILVLRVLKGSGCVEG